MREQGRSGLLFLLDRDQGYLEFLFRKACVSAGHEFCLDMGVKERSVGYGDRQKISELIAELRMLHAGAEKLSFDDFFFWYEPEFVSESLFEKHREFLFILVFDE